MMFKKSLFSLLAVAALMLLLAPDLAQAYGGGGGDTETPEQKMAKGLKSWTPDDLSKLFHGLQPDDEKEMTEMFTGAKVNKATLLKFRQEFLERDMRVAGNQASALNAIVIVLEVTDYVGNKSQQALGFVPGVGWVTSAGLGAARSAADAYKGGGDAKEIAKQFFTGGVTNGLIGKFSNADKAYNSAKAGYKLATTAMTGEAVTGGTKVMLKGITRYGLKKYGEYEGQAALQNGLNDFVDNLNNVPSETPPTDYGHGAYNGMPDLQPKK